MVYVVSVVRVEYTNNNHGAELLLYHLGTRAAIFFGRTHCIGGAPSGYPSYSRVAHPSLVFFFFFFGRVSDYENIIHLKRDSFPSAIPWASAMQTL
jgi:hypothetical protein